MKKDVIFFLTVLLFFSPVFPGPGSSEGAETFLRLEKSPISLSFENYQMRDGWTPVVLSIGEINCMLWMDAAGRISELRETGAHFVEPVCFIDVSTQSLWKGANTLYFDVYEQNRIRTRWRLSPGGTAGTVPKKILFREGGMDLCLGNLRLKLNHVAWDFQEFSPGLSQVKFYGSIVSGRGELVYEKAKGIIYSTHVWNNRLPTGPSRTWSMNLNRPTSGSISPRERAALIALYNSTDGDNWKNKSGWKTPPLAADGFALPGTENTWWGITCDPGNTTVQLIDLEYNNLNGILPPELGNLSNLQELYLGWNSLSGSLPPELGNLANLQQLLLWSNQISGSIPPQLGNLDNLREFDLMWNQISGRIPPELGNLDTLQVLHIGYNSLIGSIPQELGNLASLQSLWLHNNQFSGAIPPELGTLANLQELVLRYNQLCGTIPLELTRLSNLAWLDLSDNPLSGTIPPELGTLAKLQYLYLIRNQLSGTIPLELTNLSNLISLNLGLNQLSGTIPKELERLSNLGTLGLYFNQFSGTIPSELGNLANLGWLRLNSNQLSGSIPPELGNLANLYWLDLSRNQLSDGIPPELGNLENLKHLSIDSNQLSGNIPSNLINLKKLINGISSFKWNAIYTNDDILRAFLDSKQAGGDWESTQTIAPSDVTATAVSTSSIDIHWTPIAYTSDTGGYRVFYSTTPGGPYSYFGMTANKTASFLTVTGLNPGTNYYFVVQTRTYPHGDNQNTVDSEYSIEVSASTLQHCISGSVTCGGKGLQGVNIYNSEGRTTLTDSNGNYNMKVSYGWSGIVTPSMAGYIFSPANRSYANVTVNQIHQDYIAVLQAFTISGTVTIYGKGLPGVTITLSNGPTTITDGNGNYKVTVSYGWSGKVTPSMAGYIFSPPNRGYTNVTLNKSNQNFTASLIKSLILTSPNGGESWGFGTVRNITWTSSGLSGNIRLELWKANKRVGNIAANIPIVNGNYRWLIGQYSPGILPTGNDYRVKIITANGLYNDISDAGFSIVKPSITLTSPQGGENWKKGTRKNITWTSVGLTGNVRLILFKAGVRVGTIARGIPIANGTYAWTVGRHSNGMASAGSNYSVKICSENNRFFNTGGFFRIWG